MTQAGPDYRRDYRYKNTVLPVKIAHHFTALLQLSVPSDSAQLDRPSPDPSSLGTIRPTWSPSCTLLAEAPIVCSLLAVRRCIAIWQALTGAQIPAPPDAKAGCSEWLWLVLANRSSAPSDLIGPQPWRTLIKADVALTELIQSAGPTSFSLA